MDDFELDRDPAYMHVDRVAPNTLAVSGDVKPGDALEASALAALARLTADAIAAHPLRSRLEAIAAAQPDGRLPTRPRLMEPGPDADHDDRGTLQVYVDDEPHAISVLTVKLEDLAVFAAQVDMGEE